MILVDTREMNSVVPKQLEKFNVPLKYQTMEIGDYIVTNGRVKICVERKDVGDYVGSLISGRLHNQLYYMSHNYPYSILIVEGYIAEVLLHRKVKRQDYVSSLVGSLLKRSPDGCRGVINLVMLDTPFDTALFLKYLHDKVMNEKYERLPVPTYLGKKMDTALIGMYACIPGVGIERAKILAQHFTSLKSLLNASLSDFINIKGIGERLARKIYNFIHGGERER